MTSLLLSGCSQRRNDREFDVAATPDRHFAYNPAVTVSGPYSGRVLLEINDTWMGTQYMGGDILDFRLFEDGTVEFDDYPTDDEVKGFVQAADVARRRRFKISAELVQQLRLRLTDPEFLNLKSHYQKLTESCDAGNDLRITTREKTVRIEGWCGKREPPEYPQAIFELFEVIRNIKAVKLGRYLPTP